MRPYQVTITGSGTSQPFPLDYYQNPFQVALTVVVSGTVVYTVQHSPNNPYSSAYAASGSYSSLATWLPHATTALSGATATAESNYAFPTQATRITVSAAVDNGVTFYVLQTGPQR